MQNPLDHNAMASLQAPVFLERALFDGLPLAGMWRSKDSQHANAALCTFLGLAKGSEFDDVSRELERVMNAGDFKRFTHAMENGYAYNSTTRLALKAGDRLVKIRSFEQVDSVVCIFEDVTDEEQRVHHELLLGAHVDAFALLDAEQRVCLVRRHHNLHPFLLSSPAPGENASVEAVFKEPLCRALRASWENVVGKDDAPAAFELYFDTEDRNWEFTFASHQGMWVLFARDVTSTKHAIAALEAECDVHKYRSQAKSSFLANMSHEIRTPLNGVIGMASLALETELTAIQKEYISTSRQSALGLLALINDILDLSKIEADHMLIESTRVPLMEVIQEVVLPLRMKNGRSEVPLVITAGLDVPSHVVGDPLRIRQILTNLISNAQKFTSKGQVSLDVQLRGDDTETFLVFEVKDSGIGMNEEQLSRLFQDYQQAEASTARKFQGTGLGLAISRKLARIMEGDIEVSSEFGKGSTFTVVLPLSGDIIGLGEPTPRSSFRVRPLAESVQRILLVSPADDVKYLFGSLRGTSTCRSVASFQNAGKPDVAAAFRWLREAPDEGRRVVLDLLEAISEEHSLAPIEALPSMTGLLPEILLQVLSKLDEEWVPTVVVKPFEPLPAGLPNKIFELAAHIGRPLTPFVVDSAFSQALRLPKEASVQRPKTGTHSHVGKKRVLVAEDILVNQQVITALLGRMGHEVRVVANGQDAVTHATTREYDIILMDIRMPVLDGLGATKAIRKAGVDTPIVALTAKAMSGDMDECLKVGMDDYLTKPFEFARFEKVFNALMKERSLSSAQNRDVDDVKPPLKERPAGDATPSALDEYPALEIEKTIQRLGGMTDLYEEILGAALNAMGERRQTFVDAVQAKDHDALNAISHIFVGALATVGAAIASENARKVEHDAEVGGLDPKTTAQFLESLQDAENDIQVYLSRCSS
ncbi:MAG: response regulator [Deltaproteobacteria bacterium]|nr:response regulator [Deltaproteobacteria bacterium]